MALNINGTTTRKPHVIADAPADYFHDISSYQRYLEKFQKRHAMPDGVVHRFRIPPDRDQVFKVPFTMGELEYAL